jgi:SAM-dependent methyltransferase
MNESSVTADDPVGLRSALASFLDDVDREAATADIIVRIGGDEAGVAKRLDTYLNEAFVGLDLIAQALPEAHDVLEIGAGVGALSTFLTTQGWDVVAVEPVGAGFDFIGAARLALAAQWGDQGPRRFLDIDAALLGPEHGEFDLAFSVHVLEHVTDLHGVITALQRRVRPTGRSIHTCPNYTVPYEPHFGVPLVPLLPAVTGRLLPGRISESSLWGSLNFVTARQVRAIAHRADIDVTFEPGVMAATAKRVESDATFRERQGVVGKLAAAAVASRAGRSLLERWPAKLATPMVFTLTGSPARTGPPVSPTTATTGSTT